VTTLHLDYPTPSLYHCTSAQPVGHFGHVYLRFKQSTNVNENLLWHVEMKISFGMFVNFGLDFKN
jgi:hypothetical protein